MKKILSLLLFHFTPYVFASNLEKINMELSKLSEDKLKKTLTSFVKETRPSRFVGSVGHQKAIEFIYKHFQSLKTDKISIVKDEFIIDVDYAINFYKKDFENQIVKKFKATHPTYKKWFDFTQKIVQSLENFRGKKGTNIYIEVKGKTKSDNYLLVGGHFDSVSQNKEGYIDINLKAPGADNNATGVVTMLEFIKVLSRLNHQKNIRFAFWDFQSLGFLGSHHYIKETIKSNSKDKILGYIDLNMLGNDTKMFDKSKKERNFRMYTLKPNQINYKENKVFAKTLLRHGRSLEKAIEFELIENGHNRSDHWVFWENQVPATIFTQNMEEDYNHKNHTPDDFPERINFATFSSATKFIVGSVCLWIECF